MVWGAVSPQPPGVGGTAATPSRRIKKKGEGLGGGSHPQPPEAQNNK